MSHFSDSPKSRGDNNQNDAVAWHWPTIGTLTPDQVGCGLDVSRKARDRRLSAFGFRKVKSESTRSLASFSSLVRVVRSSSMFAQDHVIDPVANRRATPEEHSTSAICSLTFYSSAAFELSRMNCKFAKKLHWQDLTEVFWCFFNAVL